MQFKTLIKLVILAFVLTACANLEEHARRRAEMTPQQLCFQDATENGAVCSLRCMSDSISRNMEIKERGRQCEYRCEEMKSLEYRNCQVRY